MRCPLVWIAMLCLRCTYGVTYSLGDTGAGDNNTLLRILVLLPQKKGSYYFPFGLEMAGPAILSAFDDIRTEGLLPGISFKADFADSGCDGVIGIGMAHTMLSDHKYSAIIGPQCSQVCSHVARLATYLSIPCFSGVCQDVEMNNKLQFKTLTRLLGTFEMTGFAISQIVSHFGWRRVSIIAERKTDIIWLLTRDGLQYAFQQSNITVSSSVLLFAETDMERVLLDTAAVSRVIILAMNAHPLRTLMRLAIKYHLTDGDYIFICITYYKQRVIFGDYHWKQGESDDDAIKKAYSSLFFISYYNRDQSEKYQHFLKTVKLDSAIYLGYNYTENEEVPYPAANLYEATYLFAIALKETLQEGSDLNDGVRVAQRLWDRSFESLTGGVSLNANGDRNQAYMIKHLQNEVTGEIQLIGTYHTENHTLNFFPESILWPGGRSAPPPDSPACGFEGELCREDIAARLRRVISIFSGSLVGVIIVGSVLFYVIYRRLKWEKEISNMTWRYKLSDINFVNTRASTLDMLSVLSIRSSDTTSTEHSKINFPFRRTGMLKGVTITLKRITHIDSVNLTNKAFLTEMKQLHDITHTNIVRIMGATVDTPDIHLITEYCSKGSLQDILENDDIELDLTFKYSLIGDILSGLTFLHSSFRGCHGNLKSSNCVLDSRFVVKLTDFGPTEWMMKPVVNANELLWTPPELLTDEGRIREMSPQADVYALGIILQEIIYREGPFFREDGCFESAEIIRRVRQKEKPPFRPFLGVNACKPGLCKLITKCWHDDVTERPSLLEVNQDLKRIIGRSLKSSNLMDNLLQRMEHYAKNLESMVAERTSKYLQEKKRAEDLLHRLLPSSVAYELQTKGFVMPKTYNCVTVYFSDIVQFTDLCSQSSPMQVVTMLNDLYTMCDEIIAKYDVYKVETIGDAYMAVSGLPNENGDNHVAEIAKMALALRAAVLKFKIRHRPDRALLLRIGMHTGSCVAGVVGLTMPRYCLFGDTVNTASRMESSGEALKIHMSQESESLLSKRPEFTIKYRGETNIKGKGQLPTYWLISGPTNELKYDMNNIELSTLK